jgi:hypothetical protein
MGKFRFTGQPPASGGNNGKKEGPTTVTYVDTDVRELYTGCDYDFFNFIKFIFFILMCQVLM